MSKLRLLFVAVIALSLSACGTYSTSSATAAANAPDKSSTIHKKPTQIMITDKDMLDRKYTSLGDISVTVRKTTLFNSDPTPEAVNQALRERAADMGADAVILVRYGTVGIGVMSWGEMDGNGRAIVFQ